HFVAPGPQVGRLRNAAQKIGVAQEPSVEKGGLIDDRCAFAHRGLRRLLGVAIRGQTAVRAYKANDVLGAEVADQALEMPLLVLFTLAANQLGLLVVPGWFGHKPERMQRFES